MSYAQLLQIDEATKIEVAQPTDVTFKVEDGDLVVKFGDTTIPYEPSADEINDFFDVPRPFARNQLMGHQRLLRDLFTTVKRNKKDSSYQFAISELTPEGESTAVPILTAAGNANKPYIPYGQIGRAMQSAGFEIKGADLMVARGGAILRATHHLKNKVEAREGDILESGLLTHFSPTMQFNPRVMPYSHRLWCENGATEELVDKNRFHIMGSSPEDVIQEFEQIAERAFEEAHQLNQRFAELTQQEVEPARVIDGLAGHNIPQRMVRSMRNEALGLPEDQRTMYDVINILTRHATHEVQNPEASAIYMGVAGHRIADPHCTSCGSTLSPN